MPADGFSMRLDAAGSGPTVAVKDLFDMVGIPTTAGSAAVQPVPATADAACLAGIRAGARIVGRTAMHELAYGITGVNPWQGTPVNPIDPLLVPGGSSSGAAVVVANGAADVALGSDTGGSVRIPAACCGVAGLKTTWGRISLDGVWPLAPSFDTAGPLARDVAGLVLGMQLLEPGFTPAGRDVRIGRLPVGAADGVWTAVDTALAGFEVVELPELLPGWYRASPAAGLLLGVEAWAAHSQLVEQRGSWMHEDVRARFERGRDTPGDEVRAAHLIRERWRVELDEVFTRVDLLCLPTLADVPAPLADPSRMYASRLTLPVNLAGVPALALPVPRRDGPPASLQLIGAAGSEELLLAIGQQLEAGLIP